MQGRTNGITDKLGAKRYREHGATLSHLPHLQTQEAIERNVYRHELVQSRDLLVAVDKVRPGASGFALCQMV